MARLQRRAWFILLSGSIASETIFGYTLAIGVSEHSEMDICLWPGADRYCPSRPRSVQADLLASIDLSYRLSFDAVRLTKR